MDVSAQMESSTSVSLNWGYWIVMAGSTRQNHSHESEIRERKDTSQGPIIPFEDTAPTPKDFPPASSLKVSQHQPRMASQGSSL